MIPLNRPSAYNRANNISYINDDDGDNDNDSIQFFIIYVPSQQLQGQLQTQHSVDTSNYIMGKTQHKIKV
jgi:hypothetical protein